MENVGHDHDMPLSKKMVVEEIEGKVRDSCGDVNVSERKSGNKSKGKGKDKDKVKLKGNSKEKSSYKEYDKHANKNKSYGNITTNLSIKTTQDINYGSMTSKCKNSLKSTLYKSTNTHSANNTNIYNSYSKILRKSTTINIKTLKNIQNSHHPSLNHNF